MGLDSSQQRGAVRVDRASSSSGLCAMLTEVGPRRLPRIEVGGAVWAVQRSVGLRPLVEAFGGCFAPSWVYEPTYRLDAGRIVLASLERSEHIGFWTPGEAGDIGASIPFSGRMLVTAGARAAPSADWLVQPNSAIPADFVLAAEVRELVFERGVVLERRVLSAELHRLFDELASSSHALMARMNDIIERHPLSQRQGRALIEEVRADVRERFRSWAQAARFVMDYHLEADAVRATVDKAANRFHRAETQAWAQRPRARRDVDGPALVEASRSRLEGLGRSAANAAHVNGVCPRCGHESCLRVCLDEGFLLCDTCWISWW